MSTQAFFLSLVLLVVSFGTACAQRDTVQIDQIVVNSYETKREKGILINSVKQGRWLIFRVNASGKEQLVEESLFERGVCTQRKELVYNDTISQKPDHYWVSRYDNNENILSEDFFSTSDGKQFSHRYESPNRRYTTYYHPNGKISSEGWSVLSLVRSGCDAGSRLFQYTGKWKDYDETGKLVETRNYPKRD